MQPDPIGLAGGPNPYLYANGNPLAMTDPLGLSAADVEGIRRHIAENFPEIRARGGWEFRQLPATKLASSDTNTGRIFVRPDFEKACLTLDEFTELYGDILHESMHSTDPRGTRRWDALWASMGEWLTGVQWETANHRKIYARTNYDMLTTGDPRRWTEDLRGVSRGDPYRAPINGKIPALYYGTERLCECE